jgi:predicted dehydrogenase
MLNIGVVGYGYWGPNVARNFHSSPDVKLTAGSDISEKRLGLAQNHYPFIKGLKDPLELIRSKDVDAVAIVTPVFTHFELAKEALLAGKHIFVEKPFTSTSAQARELVELAARKNLRIMVDHTFLFTGAVRKIKELINAGELGKLLFYDSVRVNLGLFQHDVNVIWDLAPHDLSIMAHVIGNKPVAISAHGSVHFQGRLEDIAYVAVEFESNGFIAHFHVNWLSPVKVRKTLISGDKKMLVWDDLDADEKVKLEATEALKAEAQYFVECVEGGQDPFNDGASGLQVVRLLEAADESVKNGGRRVAL